MKSITKLICCCAMLALTQTALAAGQEKSDSSEHVRHKSTAALTGVHDRAMVEKRIDDQAAMTRSRSAIAKKNAERRSQETKK